MTEAARAEEWTFIPLTERQKPATEQMRVRLRPLTKPERMRVLDNDSWTQRNPDGTTQIVRRSFQQAYELCLGCIVRIDNGHAWPADQRGRAQYLEEMDDLVIYEIGNEIVDHCFFPRVSDRATDERPSTEKNS